MSKRKTNHMLVKRVTTLTEGIIYINKTTKLHYWLGNRFDRIAYNEVAYNGLGVSEDIDIALKQPGTRIF